MDAKYDTIGINYSDFRKPDSRIENSIWKALGSAGTVLNVGAGTGSYEPHDRCVTAIDPSAEMISQRKPGKTKVMQGYAENLPFDDDHFDASMAILTVHHWSDLSKGLSEMRRVSKGPVIILTHDPSKGGFWLDDYLPQCVALNIEKGLPPLSAYEKLMGPVSVDVVPVPHDCSDGFFGAYWRRPVAYLDPSVRKAISCFWSADNVEMDGIKPALEKLDEDLKSGVWEKKYGYLLDYDTLDLGYRLITSCKK
ncbi:MAG: class I SAM-dependent methyltransferase [Parvularculales bacterium]